MIPAALGVAMAGALERAATDPSGGASRAPVVAVARADTAKPFTGWIAKVDGGVDLWLRNTSKDTLTIDTLHLSRCSNLADRCVARPMAVTIAPGRDTLLFRARRKVAANDASFRWSLSWSRIVAAPESTTVRWPGRPGGPPR